jgi:ABC-type Fe3+-hydroxamate transport system substrate-binding protein
MPIHPPQRIISLVPSQTELLFDLGLEEEVVGITKFCVHPMHWFRTKARVGGTKQIHTDLVAALHPDLIIANKEENVKEQIEELEKIAPVWVSEVSSVDEAYQMILDIGNITGKAEKARALTASIRQAFDILTLSPADQRLRTAYLIWKDPYMTIGGDTFIHDMLRKCGFENVFSEMTRYPEISVETLRAKKIDVLLLSTEPYPFGQQHIAILAKELPGTKILLADGEYFSWYGSRMLHAPVYMHELRKKVTGIDGSART